MFWLTVSFGIVAVVFSFFFGFNACEIFSVPKPEKKSKCFYLFWFNFFGSIVGWAAFWIILFKILRYVDFSCQADIGFGDLVLALVAFAGITGHLPMATMGIFVSFGDLAKNLFKKWLMPPNNANEADVEKPSDLS